MSAPSESPAPTEKSPSAPADPPGAATPGAPSEPPPSYVKLAMRNMVRKRGKALVHFALSTVALLALFVGLAYLTR